MAQHTKTRLEYALEDLQPEARAKALADFAPYVDDPEVDPERVFIESCEEHGWRFYADGTPVKENS